MADPEVTPSSKKRDIKNHMLFEIATEVANRGEEKLCFAVLTSPELI